MNQQTEQITDEGLAVPGMFIRGATVHYRQVLESIGKEVPFTEALVVTCLPRGSLRIAQPARVPESLVKAYGREFHGEDRLTWRAIASQKPVTIMDCWGEEGPENSRYVREFLQGHGLKHVVAAPLRAPILEGYPGAVHLCRSAELGPFSAGEIEAVARLAKQLDQLSDEARAARRSGACSGKVSWAHRPSTRQFVVDGQVRPHAIGAKDGFGELDDSLRQQMLQHARHRLEQLDGQSANADRLQLPDGRGDLWTFRVVTHRSYPALGKGPFIFFCLQPDCCDWSTVRATDFPADRELARLIPALRFMQQEYNRSPTLGEIARTAHLSPFHFHRQFTELLGLTPKHFLLECQISDAKRELVARTKNLAQIATDCGFAHQSHFTSRFKQATGLTPTRWRRLAMDRENAAAR